MDNVTFTYTIPCYGRVRVKGSRYHFLSLGMSVRAASEIQALRLIDEMVADERERQMAESMW